MAKKAKDDNVKKQKVTVRELAPKFKVTEIKGEESGEGAEMEGESPLEDIATDAPSAREFPGAVQNIPPAEQAERAEELTPTPAATTEAEGRTAARYQIQTNISEMELKRVYNTQSAESREIAVRNTMLTASQKQLTNALMRNPEVEAVRGQTAEEERQYEVTPEGKPKTERRKYPWEA